MAKYSFELKLQIVKVYLEGKGGYNGIAKMSEFLTNLL